MRAINLLPRDDPKRSFEAKRGVAFGAAGGFALVSVCLAALMLTSGGARQEQQSRLDALHAELESLPGAAAETQRQDAVLAAAKTQRINALSTALAGRIAWDRVLRELSQVLPEDVWLKSLTSQDVAEAAVDPTVSGMTIVLSGSTYSQSGVARLLARLSVVPALGNVRLQSSAAEPVGKQRIVSFTILADVRAGVS